MFLPHPSRRSPSEFPPSGHCLYLLASRLQPDRFKMGITGNLAARMASLRVSFGELDLSASALLVGIASRREAHDRETTLKSSFAAPVWRCAAPIARPGTPLVGNGHKEWYRRVTLAPMLAVLTDTLAQEEAHGVVRYALWRGLPAIWGERDPDAGGLGREERRALRRDRAGREALVQSEERFGRLVSWMEAQRQGGRLLSASLLEEDLEGVLRREFTFAPSPGTVSGDLRRGAREWEDLLRWGHLSCHTHKLERWFNYLSCVTLPDDDSSVYTVEFSLNSFFRSVSPEDLVPHNDLPRCIWGWVAGEQKTTLP